VALSGLYSWAIREGLADLNPVQGTNRPVLRARDRVLTKDELTTLWRGLDGRVFDDFVRLLILTGQRRNEIGHLRWSEIVDESIVLSPDRTKNARAHIVPLSPLAAEIIDRQPRLGERVFSGIDYGRGKQAIDARVNLPGWVLHDLRRSVATGMAELGVLPHIIETVLNHVSGHKASVAGIYNRARYADEVRAALTKWSDYVEALR
jgi:integrase